MYGYHQRIQRPRTIGTTAIVVIIFLYRQMHLLPSKISDNVVDHLKSTKRNQRHISGGFLTTHSGCRICKWLYSQERNTRPLFKECTDQPPDHQLRRPQVQQHLRENDTIFVPFMAIQQFVDEILDDILVNVVIISGQTHNVPKVSDDAINTLLDHPRVLHWFCQNLPVYGGSNLNQTYHHRKISPFPYGLKETGGGGKLIFESYKRVYFKNLYDNNNTNTNSATATAVTYNEKKKKTLVYAGPLGKTTPARGSIPQSKQSLHPEAYFTKMAESQYILSPNGDRPDCYRHYEALGLGTIPITELDPILFRHLMGGPVVFGNEDWRMQSLLERFDDHAKKKQQVVVNQDLIWEDYWMDWVEEEVGIGELNWRVFENEELIFGSN